VQTVTVTLHGTNDATAMTSTAAQASGAVTEQAGITASLAADTSSGTVAFHDADLTDTHRVVSVVPQGAGYLGSFTLGTLADSTGGVTGSVPWSFSVPDGALDFLAAGQTLVQTYNVTLGDLHLTGQSVQTVTVTLIGTNDAPVVHAIAADVNEQGPASTLTASYTDLDAIDSHTFTVDATGTVGLVTNNHDGTFGYDANGQFASLAQGETATDSFSYTVDDGHGGAAIQTATVTIIGQNDAPVAQAIAANVGEQGPAVFLTASYTDPDTSDSHSFTIDTTATLGLVTNNGDGTFNYDPNGQFASLTLGQTATDTFTYTVDDGHGGTATQTATVTIFGPAAQTIGADANEDGPAVVLAGLSDGNPANSYTFAVDTTGTVGLVTNNGDGTFSYDANGKFESLAEGETATDSFSYTISDGIGGVSTAIATVTIIGQNDAPVAQAIAAVVDEHGPAVTLTASFSDVDVSDTHTFDIDQSSTLGTVTNNGDGTFGYDPNGQFASLAQGETATDTFTYTVTDNNGLIATETATVTITGQNDAPVASPDTLVAAAGATTGDISAALLSNDTDVDTAQSALIISAVNTAGTLGTVSLDPVTHALTYTAPTSGGPDSFQYTVSDGLGGTSNSVVSINADTLVTDNWLVTEGKTATFSAAAVLANDSAFDGGALSLLSVSGAHVSLHAGVITYTAAASDPSGLGDSFTYTTSDSLGRLATGTVDVALWDGSTTPIFGNPSIGSDANQAERLIAAPATGPLTMTGTAGADRIVGGNGHTTGGNGGDTIIGGGGGDTLTGGAALDHFVYNYGGPSAPNYDSKIGVGAMDTITDFTHGQGPNFQEVMEINGFGFTAAGTASITSVTVAAASGFTASDKAGYFSDGNVVHVEQSAASPGSAQVYIDANQSGSFEAASDLVIHLDHLTQGLVSSDFQFH